MQGKCKLLNNLISITHDLIFRVIQEDSGGTSGTVNQQTGLNHSINNKHIEHNSRKNHQQHQSSSETADNKMKNESITGNQQLSKTIDTANKEMMNGSRTAYPQMNKSHETADPKIGSDYRMYKQQPGSRVEVYNNRLKDNSTTAGQNTGNYFREDPKQLQSDSHSKLSNHSMYSKNIGKDAEGWDIVLIHNKHQPAHLRLGSSRLLTQNRVDIISSDPDSQNTRVILSCVKVNPGLHLDSTDSDNQHSQVVPYLKVELQIT